MSRSVAQLQRSALLAALALAPVAAGQDGRWSDVTLAPGFALDLATGELVAGDGGALGHLCVVGRRLVASPPLRAWMRPEGGWVSGSVTRGGGVPVDDLDVEAGLEFVFDLDPACWGYLRVLALEEGEVQLEYARAPAGAAHLARDPRSVELDSTPEGHALRWFAEPRARYVVTRRRVGGGEAPEEVARVSGGNLTDTSAPAGALVEYRVARDEDAPPFGARARAVRAERPGEWPLELRAGMRIDLLTGAVDGARADVEVAYVNPPSLALRVEGGTRLATLQGGVAGGEWRLPEPLSGRYDEKMRSIPVDGEVAALLPEGPLARLDFRLEGGRVVMLRQLDLYGRSLMPRAPEAPALAWEDGELAFTFPQLRPGTPDADAVHIVVERELGYLRGDWEELQIAPPGARQLSVHVRAPADGQPLARFRFRHRYPFGVESFAGAPLPALLVDPADATATEALLDGAFRDLEHADYERRLAARGVLELLGERAWPRLEVALSSANPELAAAARELLLRASLDGGAHVEFVLRARGAVEGVDVAAPPGWFDPSGARRAWAALRAHGAHPGAPAWTRVLALADPDPAVRALAEHLGQAPAPPDAASVPGVGAPFVLTPPGADRPPPQHDWRWEVLDSGPHELAAAVRESVDPRDAEVALATLMVAEYLEERAAAPDAPRWRGPAGQGSTVELALRLIDRYREEGDAPLLAAARRLVESAGIELAALRELSTLRLGWTPPPAGTRARIELDAPDIERLEGLVAELAASGRTHVDVVLPPGEYALPDDALDHWIDLPLAGLRLIGGEGVVLAAGLRVQGTPDIVLEDVAVVNRHGSALILVGSSCVLRRCRLLGTQSIVTLQDSALELDECELASAESGSSAYAVRMTMAARLLARATCFDAGTILLSDEATAYLDRCVVSAGNRAVVQGSRSGAVVARDCLFQGQAMGFFNLGSALVAGIVIDVARDPMGHVQRVRACPRSTHVLGPDQRLRLDEFLPDDPLAPR